MSESPGLYVHIPFCSVKCFYCDFTAFSGQKRQAARYLAALESEARLHAGFNPSTLYVGGGTPSELEVGELSELFALLSRRFPDAGYSEATCEANPDSLSKEKLEVMIGGGIDRLSLGLQTADDRLLASVGRKHTFADFLDVYRAARSLGGLSISVDLMYGLPGQNLESLRRSLDAVIALEPEHLSLYGLQVEDRTLFSRRGVEPDEDEGRDMFEAALDRLASAGYRHYEISNFARPGYESAHNRNYWKDGEYLGLGCGASSHLGGERSSNAESLGRYCDKALAGARPTDETERLSGREKLGETVWLGLRLLEGLSLTPEMRSVFAPQWERLRRRGWISLDGGRARLTREGIFLANQAALEFVPPFDREPQEAAA